MRGNNSTAYYRRGGHKKRRWRRIVIIALILLVAVILSFLIVGNILNKKNSDTDVSTKKATATQIENLASPYSIKGVCVDINNPSETLVELSKNSERDVSIKLSTNGGELLYNSPTAQKFGYQSSSSSLVDLSALIKKIKSYGMTSNAVIDLNGFSEMDAKARSVLLAYEAAIVCEIYEYGASDITVRCSENASEHMDGILNFSKTVKNINPDVKVGISLTNDFFDHPDASVYIDQLAREYTFICIDLTDSGEAEIAEYIDSSLSNSNNRYYILRYNMRVLLPQTDDEQTEAAIQKSIDDNSIHNWQKIS